MLICLDALFLACLTFAVFNILKYLVPRRENSALIILFYIIVIIDCTVHVGVLTWSAFNPSAC